MAWNKVPDERPESKCLCNIGLIRDFSCKEELNRLVS
jgi:hypothetical protein